jgi:hypothetical protein
VIGGFVVLLLVNGWFSVRVGEIMGIVGMELVAIAWVIAEMVRDGKTETDEEVDLREDRFITREY